MSEFKVGDEKWTISTKLKTKKFEGIQFGYEAWHKSSLTLDNEPYIFFKTKNEAIDAMIERLNELRD
jgi:hypothetical protein